MNCCAAILTESNRATAGARIAHGGPRLWTLARRGREAAGWIVPSGILALLPKCPACIVAYLAVGSGIGISVSTAIYLRMGLVILCTAALAYFALRRGRRFMARYTDEMARWQGLDGASLQPGDKPALPNLSFRPEPTPEQREGRGVAEEPVAHLQRAWPVWSGHSCPLSPTTSKSRTTPSPSLTSSPPT